MSTYRRPGVYLEETLLAGPNEVGVAASVTLFAGAAARGPFNEAVRCDSWADYVGRFGSFDPAPGAEVCYLPYAVYSHFQNGGRVAYVSRAVNSASGTAAEFVVPGTIASGEDAGDEADAFTIKASSPGAWGNSLSVAIDVDFAASASNAQVFSLVVYRTDSSGNLVELERFSNLSMTGDLPGTKRVDTALNDEQYGSRYVIVTDPNRNVSPTEVGPESAALLDGADGTIPTAADLLTAAIEGAAEIEGPIVVNIAPHRTSSGTLVLQAPSPTVFGERSDVFVINDAAPPRTPGSTGDAYADAIKQGTPMAQVGTGSSYVACYTPWITITDPAVQGGTITIPPGGAVAGVYSRTDATEGIFRAPAGVIAGISNAVNVDAKFSNTKQAELNSNSQFNVIRPVAGVGIAIMGGRTRKKFSVDRYVSARRTLIYIKESLRVSSSFAVFENNDERLWTRLQFTADNILRPIWSSGGLRGGSAAEAYYIVCDSSINTPQVIASGEVRMEVGVALEYPAEFVVIRVSQFDGGSTIETDLT
jgi:uncharacterized protein